MVSCPNPGLELLSTLDEMHIIRSSDVNNLVLPLQEFKLIQAAAIVREYQALLDGENHQDQLQQGNDKSI